MPLDGLDEEGLPRNPDLHLVQLKFLLTVEDGQEVDKEETWKQLLEAIKENCERLLCHVHTHWPSASSYTYTQHYTHILNTHTHMYSYGSILYLCVY